MDTWGRQGTHRSGQDSGCRAGPHSWQVTEVKGESARGREKGGVTTASRKGRGESDKAGEGAGDWGSRMSWSSRAAVRGFNAASHLV